MTFTREPSFDFSLLEDGIETTFRFEDLGNVPGILNEVGDTGSNAIESDSTDYFDPFFSVHLPARGKEPVLSDGKDGYTVDDLFVFGDRLTENGGEFGKNAVGRSTGANPPYDVAPTRH